jgi:hypothetical protein
MQQTSTLERIVSSVRSLDPDGTIYAKKPWTPTSPAMVAVEPADGAKELPEGYHYFLEVFTSIEVLEDWARARKGPGTPADQCARLIDYAINDA